MEEIINLNNNQKYHSENINKFSLVQIFWKINALFIKLKWL